MYQIKYVQSFVVVYVVAFILYLFVDWYELLSHIFLGCFTGTASGATLTDMGENKLCKRHPKYNKLQTMCKTVGVNYGINIIFL